MVATGRLYAAPVDTGAPFVVVCTGPPGTGKSTIATALAQRTGASLLAWDWVMGALTGFESVHTALGALDRAEYRRVGWAVLWNLAEAQLRVGRPVVLDGVARTEEIARTRALAVRLGARSVVVLTECCDPETQRRRIERRDRAIPGWHELTWENVSAFMGQWEPPEADLVVDTAADPDPVAIVGRVIAAAQ